MILNKVLILQYGGIRIKIKKNFLMLILAFAFVFTILGTSAAAVNGTGNNTNTSIDLTSDCSTGSDPIISGTVTVNEYGHIRPLEGATVIANSTSGVVMGSTTTDANGHYTLNFYSTETTFNIIANYIGCTPITKSITVTNSANYPTDPNKYGTANFELTPKTATLTSTGNGQSVYIQGQNKDGFAGVINVRVDGTIYTAYCIDLFTPISTGDTLLVNGPLPGTAGDLPSEVEWDKVSYILNHYNPSSDNEAAAIQCAIWYFTSVHYGVYNPSAPVGTYYQYMTAPRDGVIRNWWSDDTSVRTRAWAIINAVNAATIPSYPNSITVTPETTTVANGQTVTVTATVRDVNGNPLQGVTVNFQTTKGTLSRNSATTDANGQVTVTLSNIGNNSNAMLTAYVSGNYGNLLYDDQYASVRKQNLVARNVLPLTISAFSIIKTAASANVALTQSATTPVNVGDTVTYTVTATNNGPSDASGILISDILPAGLSGVTVTPSVGTYYNGVWTIPTLANGASATLRITGIATAAMAGLTTTNTATRTSQEQYNNQPTTTTAGVYTKKADLSLSQTVNGQSTGTINGNVGDSVTFRITATNNGPDAATNISIRDIIPGGLTGLTITPSVGTYNPNTGIWTIPSLANGASATLTITGTIGSSMAGQTTTNTGNVISQTEYDPTTPSTTSIPVYTKIADVAVTQTVNNGNSATVNVNDTVTYIITAVNRGVDAATNLQITDLLPSGLTDLTYTISGTGTYNPSTGLWNIGILNSGATTILTITGKVTAAMAGLTTTNYANRTSQTEYNPSVASTSTTVYTKLSDPIITQTVNGQSTGTVNVNVGDDVTIVVNAYCSGPDDATNIQIRDIIPAGLTGVTVTPSVGTYDPNTGIWTIPFLEKFTTTTLTINGKAGTSMAGTSITNRATEIFQTEYNPQPGDSTSIPVYTKMADVTLTQTGGYQGNVVNFTINATNNGPDTATNIKITDLIPSGLTGVTVTPSIGTYDPNTGIWTIPELLNGATATLTITGTATPQTTVTNTAEKTSQTEYDPNTPELANLSVYVPIVDIRIYQYPWLYDSATGTNVDEYMCSNTPVMVMQVNNGNYDDATGVIATYVIGNGFEYINCNSQGVGTATYNNLTRTITWIIGNMPKGGIAFMKIYLKIIATGNKTPNLTNTAQLIHVDQYDGNNANNKVSYGLISPKSADIQVSQILETYVQDGSQYVNYIITVNNNGPDNATNLQIKDLLPLTVQWISDNSGGLYNPSTGIWNIGTFNYGESTKTIIIVAKIIGTGTVQNTAQKYQQGENDWNYNNNGQTTILNVSGTYTPQVDIRVYHYPWYYDTGTQTYEDSYMCSNTPVFVMQVSNSNSYGDATGVVMEYIIGDGFEYIDCNSQGVGTATYNNLTRTITWIIGNMPKGGVAFLKVYTKIIGTGDKTSELTNTAQLKQVDQIDVNVGNNKVSYSISSPAAADIQVSQVQEDYTENNTTYLIYTVNVNNNGPNNATGLTIIDKLPTGVTYVSHSISNDGGITWNNNDSAYNPDVSNGIWTIGTFNCDEATRILKITVKVTGKGVIKNTAQRNQLTENDWNYDNNGQTTTYVYAI